MKKILSFIFILFVPFFVFAAEQSYNTLFDIGSYGDIEDCENSAHFSTFNNGLAWYARWSGDAPTSKGSETVTCKLRNGSTKTYTFKYTNVIKETTQQADININNLNPEYEVFNMFPNIYNITDVSTSNTNIDISKCVKNTNSCIITAKDFSKEGSGTVTLKYVDEDKFTFKVTLTVNISASKIYLNIGGYGSCTTTGWTKDGNTNTYYKKSVSDVTLPSCTPSSKNSSLITFEGWVPTNSISNTTSVDEFDLTVGNCTKLPGLVKAGGKADNNYSAYSTCYSYKSTFELIPDGGTMSGVSCTSNTNGACLIVGKTSLTLPKVTPTDPKYEFVGWVDSRTGNVSKAGSSVSIDSGSKVTFRAKYDIKKVNENHQLTLGIALNAKTVSLTKLADLDGITFNNATVVSGGEFAKLTKSGGEMMVVPQKVGQTVITSKVTNGSNTDTYTITIDVYDSNSSIRRTEYAVVDEDDYSVSWDDEEIVNITETGSLGVCDTYTVANGHYTPYYVNGNHRFNIYKVTSGCGTNKEYQSMCLDPGLLGPGGGQTYKFHHKLDLSDNYERVLYMLVSELVGGDRSDANYGAVNFLGRVFSFLTGRQRNDYIVYTDHYDIYSKAAAGNKSGFNSKSKTFNWGSGYSASGSFKSSVETLYAKAIDTYYGGYSAVDEEDSEILLKNDKKEFKWTNNTTLVVTRTGKIKLPKGAKNPKFNHNCGSFSGYSCSTSVGSSVDGEGYRDYTLTITISNVNKNTPIPDNDGNRLQFTLSYDGGMSKGTAFMIEHQTNTYAYQRMILINLGSNEFVIYGDINGDGCNTSNSALNPNNCTSSSSCNVNEALFEELNCCSKITDKSSYAFKRLCSGGDCTYDTFTPVCNNGKSSKVEITQISEAKSSDGGNNYSCIVAVADKAKTNNIKDKVGNKYSLDLYSNNKYCRVSCKEDWYYTTGVYGNFVGDNAVIAGSYFVIRDDLFLSNKRTCVTTYIEYGQYMSDVTNAAFRLVDAWNEYAKARTEYSALYDVKDEPCYETHPYYYDKAKSGSTATHYHCTQAYCARGYYNCSYCSSPKCETYKCKTATCAEYKTDPETGLSTGVCARRNSLPATENASTCAVASSICYSYYSQYYSTGYNDGNCASCGSYYSASSDAGSSWYCSYRLSASTNETIGNCQEWYTDTVYKKLQCTEYHIDTKGNEPYKKHDKYVDSDTTLRLAKKTYSTNNTTTGAGPEVTDVREPTGYQSSRVTNYGTFGHTAGECRNENCAQMKTRYLNELKANVDTARANVNNIINEINGYAEQFAACQNFALATESLYSEFQDGSHRYSTFSGKNLYSSKNLNKGPISSTNIVHKFSPFVSYSYEEEDYMKMIGSDNYMVPYTEKNSKGGSLGKASDGTDVKVAKFVYTTEYSNSETKNEDVYNNNSMTVLNSDKLGGNALSSFSCNRTNPNDKSCNGWIQLCPVYDGGYETIYYKDGSLCHTGSFSYYQVHYIRQSVYNGSYWKNKGLWYVNNEDEKSHADTLSEAASRSYVIYSRGVEDDWSVLGGYNVFPVSMSTRANLYQYYYNFFNIGMYNDGSLGRIMGGEVDLTGKKVNNSHSRTVVAYNTHACFYEVVESICRCCGEKIVPYTNEVTGVDTSYYSSKYRGSKKMSDITMKATQGTLAMFTNTISLSNFSSASNRVLGANWQAQTPFFYSGNRFYTDQGSELLSAIQSVGDTVYTKYPDYSYTLSPSAIANIKDYNKSHSYAIDTKNLKIYGRVPFKASDTFNGGEQITFNHYGSKYLESTLNQYITPEYKGHTLVEKTGPSSICTVNQGQVASQYNKQNYSSSCRWVDYNTSQGYRLAFK